MPLQAVTKAEVVVWVARMHAVGLSASRVRQPYHLFSSMLSAAVRDRRLATNPAAGVDLPRLPRKERRYLGHDELADLAAACGPYETRVVVLGYTGLRWGEVAALRVKRVDTMRGRLDPAEAVTEVNGKLEFGTPKTHQSRSVPVPEFLRDRLTLELAARSDDFVFGPRAGECSGYGTSGEPGSTQRRAPSVSMVSCRTNSATPRHPSPSRLARP